MSSPPQPQSNKEFSSFLADADLRSQYEKEVKIAIRRTKRNFKENAPLIENNFREGFRKDDIHRLVLNAAIFPFATSEVSGYYFIRAAPLLELGVKNLDFLITCPQPQAGESRIAILGEAKGSINDPDRVVSETKSRISIVNNHREYIKRQYLDNSEYSFEFVLAVPAIDASEVSKSVDRKGGNIIVWSVDTSDIPLLLLHRPVKQDEETFQTMFHGNKSLNDKLSKKIDTYTQYKMFYQQSHQLAKLRILFGIDKGREGGIFSYDHIKALVGEELHYITENDIIERETSSIVELARKIEFLEDLGNRMFKIKCRYKNAAGKEHEIIRIWIKQSIEKQLNENIDEEIISTQDSFRRKRLEIPRLNDF